MCCKWMIIQEGCRNLAFAVRLSSVYAGFLGYSLGFSRSPHLQVLGQKRSEPMHALTTFTVLLAVAVLPATSLALYVTR